MNAPLQMAEIRRAVEWLRENVGEEDFDVMLPDFIEGETDIDRIVQRIYDQMARDEEILAGIKLRQEAIAERKQRITARVAASKGAIGQFLRAARLTKLELPEVTFSVRDGKPTLRVLSDDAVPEEYCTLVRKPVKAAINEAFDGETDLPNWLQREPARDVVTARVR